MASLFKQKKSKFWWINFRDAATGRVTRTSTKLTDFIRARNPATPHDSQGQPVAPAGRMTMHHDM